MQDRPDKTVLLKALSAFLARDVVPAIDDRGLSFRVRIAAHLVAGLAREVSGEHDRDAAELSTFHRLLGDEAPTVPDDPEALQQAVRDARAALAAHIRSAELDDEQSAALRTGLREVLAARIAVGQPRFDLSDAIEEPTP